MFLYMLKQSVFASNPEQNSKRSQDDEMAPFQRYIMILKDVTLDLRGKSGMFASECQLKGEKRFFTS
jgi:hypothetical protein